MQRGFQNKQSIVSWIDARKPEKCATGQPWEAWTSGVTDAFLEITHIGHCRERGEVQRLALPVLG